MKILKVLSLIAVLSTTIFAKEYVVSNNSEAKFTLKYQKTKDFEATFKELYGVINYDENTQVIHSLKGEVEVDSINPNSSLNSLILSDKILDSKKFQTISFVATHIQEDSVIGELTIKNVKRSVEFDLINSGIFLDKLYLTLNGTIKRSHFDLSWDELLDTGSSAVSNEINITINIEAKPSNDIEFQFKKEKKR